VETVDEYRARLARSGLTLYRFARLHIPSGRLTYATHPEASELAFLRLLDRWNAQRSPWKYWREDAS